MSLSASLSLAANGLGLSARRAELVATNVAHADRPGYARRELFTGPAGRAMAEGTARPALVALRRDAEARAGSSDVGAAFLSRLDAAIGDPDQQGSLHDRVVALEGALVAASDNPSGEAGLRTVAARAGELTAKINALGDLIATERQSAETEIASAVDGLRRDLELVRNFNADIQRARATGTETAGIIDARSRVIDRINVLVPVRELSRNNGSVALASAGGALLLDGRAAELGFGKREPITAAMAYPDALSGLTIDGHEIPLDGEASPIAGGRLAALFALRDVVAPSAQTRLDGLATELVARTGTAEADPTLGPGQGGLFTDAGGPFDPAAGPGLAGRLSVNALVRTDSGEAWRLRDGFGAVAPGLAAGAGNLSRLAFVLADAAAPLTAELGVTPGSVPALVARFGSIVSGERVSAESEAGLDTGTAALRRDARDGAGVDVDAEMRRLVEIEQAYAANARVLQAVGEMMDRLTGI